MVPLLEQSLVLCPTPALQLTLQSSLEAPRPDCSGMELNWLVCSCHQGELWLQEQTRGSPEPRKHAQHEVRPSAPAASPCRGSPIALLDASAQVQPLHMSKRCQSSPRHSSSTYASTATALGGQGRAPARETASVTLSLFSLDSYAHYSG